MKVPTYTLFLPYTTAAELQVLRYTENILYAYLNDYLLYLPNMALLWAKMAKYVATA